MPDARLKEALKKYFGFENFKPAQERVINSVLSGRDTLAIMPTGGGKSLCYQLPALVSDGLTIVVSPLIALMKDQVESLQARSIPCGCINSVQSLEERRSVFAALERGSLKLLYVAPERFRSDRFINALKKLKISLFAIDEAHCISQWGHDFRPDYTRLDSAIEKLGNPQRAAFTATATPDVKEDILSQLKMRSPEVFISGFERPNLSMNISEVGGVGDKLGKIAALARDFKTGIIYCATRKSVEKLSANLEGTGINFVSYHAGMTPAQRDLNQEKFMSGLADIAVATNAFGMGIDRPDIRFVCHYEIPGSIEAYYQEAGRAGRDGNASKCEILFSYADKRVQEFFIEGVNPKLDSIRAVYKILRKNAGEDGVSVMSLEDISEAMLKAGVPKTAASTMGVSAGISLLRKHGYIERFDIGGVRARATRIMNPDISARDIVFPEGLLEEKRRRDEARLKDVLEFAYSRGCRQKWILEYFGQTGYGSCGVCDECLRRISSPAAAQLSETELTIVRKALSGIARMSYKTADPLVWRPRFGREKVALCLVGSRDAKIASAGLNGLSTFGILKHCGGNFVRELISRLIDADLAYIEKGEYPLLGITRPGAEFMLSRTDDCPVDFPRGLLKAPHEKKEGKKRLKSSRSAAPAGQADGFDPENLSPEDRLLYERLAAHRAKMAAVRRVKLYQIFSNKTLAALAVSKPRTAQDALNLPGIGEAKAAKILPGFLKIINGRDL